jgi:hypothetical protein
MSLPGEDIARDLPLAWGTVATSSAHVLKVARKPWAVIGRLLAGSSHFFSPAFMRRQLMEAWAQWCEPMAPGSVVAFGKRG